MRDVVLLGIGAVVSLGLTEFTEVSPWMAQRLVGWAARRWSADADAAAAYAEEWAAIIEERPGKLLKLATALGLLVCAGGRAVARSAAVISLLPESQLSSIRRRFFVGAANGLAFALVLVPKSWGQMIAVCAVLLGLAIVPASLRMYRLRRRRSSERSRVRTGG